MRFRQILSGLMNYYQNRNYNRFRKQYNIDPTFQFNGPGTILYGDGKIILESNSYIGRYSSIQSFKGCTVKVGKHCQISHFVKIYTISDIADQDFSQLERLKTHGNVTIGDHCWIGAGVFIREGVTIGENSIVGANSVVTHDIPSYSIFGGIPAKLIKYKNCKPDGGETL